uniref:C-type lectin domain-containing protein n=1 Tax=Cyprinus carpio TaxID=7962 RepID=A0A8C2ESZ0_CYPCA
KGWFLHSLILSARTCFAAMSACSFPTNPLDYKENYFLCNIRNLTSMSYSCHFFLSEAANAVNFQSVAWIGFYRVIWRWSYQNMPISYEMWLPGDPDMPDADAACVVQTSGEWGDRDCTDQYGFFCQTGKKLYSTHRSL